MPKTVKTEDIVVGKDILELLGSAMYADPMNVYREYIQNAVDSIDEAEEAGLYSDEHKQRIDIDLDLVNRKVTITDNGKGIPNTWFKRILLSFGASKKRGTDARGFRGVGRLAGLGYCKYLIFESRNEGQNTVSKMVWDCVELKRLLLDSEIKLNLAETVETVTNVTSRSVTDEDLPHFFKVTLESVIRHGNDLMLNEDIIHDYLSQVAPVPFSAKFEYGKYIENELNEFGCYCDYAIYLKDKINYITRPHQDYHTFKEGMLTSFHGLPKFFKLDGINEMAAVGWLLHSDYFGAFPQKTGVGGLRVRSGNIQIGDGNILSDCFPETRFNNWAVGEIHLLSKKLIPNGRRDNLELNTHYDHLKSAVKVHCNDIAREIRDTSIQRNILKNSAKLRNQVEGDLSNPDLPRDTIVEDLKTRVEIELDKLDNHNEFKDRKNVHHDAYNRETEAIESCLSKLETIPAKNNNGNIDPQKEVKIGNVLDVLRNIGISPSLVKKFIAEIKQVNIEYK
jgi:hypothetical protein